jgi:D-alanyl-D-alanine carboxypeptidase
MRQWVMGAMAAAVLVAMPADAKTKHHAVRATAQTSSRQATMVVDADTGEVLEASNVDTRLHPASLTKMMTLYMLFDAMDSGKVHLSDRMPVSHHAASQPRTKLYLKAGKTVSVQDAILGMITLSANDAAVVVAEYLGGSEPAFAQKMTQKAHELGMTRTSFFNASGLPDMRQDSTARDMATLAHALLHNHAKEYRYFSTTEFDFQETTIHGHNHLMENYDGADGIKTGYTDASGFNLVASAKRNGRRLIAVMFGGNTAAARDHQVAKLLDAGFSRAPGSAGVELAEAPPQQEEADEPAADKAARAVMTAMAKVPPHKQVAEGDTDDEEEWAVQVGSYSSQAKAVQMAQVALAKMGKYGDDGEAKAVPLTKKGKHVATYASRVVGLSKDDAQNACRSLSKHHHPCRAINIG